MAPEMAFSYLIGLIPSGTTCIYHYFTAKKHMQNQQSIQIQKQLSKLSLQWSFANEQLVKIENYNAVEDWRKLKKSILILSTFMFFLSWIGFFFHLFLIFVIRHLGLSRLQKYLISDSFLNLQIHESSFTEVRSYLSELSHNKQEL